MTPGTRGGDPNCMTIHAVKERIERIQILNQEGKPDQCEYATFRLVVDVILAIATGTCEDPKACCLELVPVIYPAHGPSTTN